MILITGVAGFIGFHTAHALLSRDEEVIGLDNLNDYYDPKLKQARLQQLNKQAGFTFHKIDISDRDAVFRLLEQYPQIDRIVHLAAQAGVRYSIENPAAYTSSNLVGHVVMLELARELQERGKLKHFVYASSSSVYGANEKKPFAVGDPVDQPVSFYAATKRSGELMTQSYSHLYQIPATGLRFFTVYGPWGRPDMAYYIFTKDILEGKEIEIFNHGEMFRDFTWIEDVVSGILAALDHPPDAQAKYIIGKAPHRLFNLGNNKTEDVLDLISIIENVTGKKAKKVYSEMVRGDVKETYADIEMTKEILGYHPKVPISEGIPKVVEWYKEWVSIT